MNSEHSIESGKIVLNGQVIHEGRLMYYTTNSFNLHLAQKGITDRGVQEIYIGGGYNDRFTCSSYEVLNSVIEVIFRSIIAGDE